MKRLIIALITCALLFSMLGACDNTNSNTDTDTTTADTEPQKIPEVETRKSKAYPNALSIPSYNLLTNSEKVIYEAIAKLISSPEASKSIALKQSVKVEAFDIAMDIFRGNFATHSDVLDNITFTADADKIAAVMISDDFNSENFEKEYNTIIKRADDIISAIPTGLSDKEIVFEIVDYLIANTRLVDDSEATTIYTTLTEGVSDSEGLAKSFDLLLKKAGIPSFVVYGYTENHEYDYTTNTSSITYTIPEPRHYWNYLCLWNKWYSLDLSKLHPVWFDSGELFLNIDELMLYNDLPYYFYRNDMDKMQTPMTEQWQNNVSSYETADEVIEIIKQTKLEVLAKNAYEYALNIKFKNFNEAEKFLSYNKTIIKDKTGTEYILHLRKESGEVDIINVTPVKVVDFDNLLFTNENYKIVFCYGYDEDADYQDQEILTNFEPITISFDIPEHWNGADGRYFKYFDKSDYPGYISAMTVMRLIQADVTLDEANSRRLIGGELYMSEFFTGTTSKGNRYSYFLQKEPRGIEGYYSVLIQISPDYIVHLYIEDELEREDIIMKFIDSVKIAQP